MSEDERAAKAARAKAMLKKRQQKKTVAAPVTEFNPSPLASPPVSRTFSPAPSEPTEEIKDLGDVFLKDGSDTSWLTSLPRVDSPLAPRSSDRTPPPVVSAATSPPTTFPPPNEKETLLQSQQQTISLLVSEKASLTAQLERLEELESRAQEKESLLENERSRSKALDDRVQQLQTDAHGASGQIQQLQLKEKDLVEKCRDQERELQLTTANINELRAKVDDHRRRVRELEEQIQSDDRVERLENSLKNTQDRADELEFQLSKLKQAHSTLKAEREVVESELRAHLDNEMELKSKHSDLQNNHSVVQQQLDSVTKLKESLSQEKSQLQSQLEFTEQSFGTLQEKLTLAASELATITRQLQAAQAELKMANRRADDAERTQKDLQVEGTNLMRSLDEMRPKIIELTGVKLELGEKVDSLQHTLRSRDLTIAQLESTVDELNEQKREADKQWPEVLALREAELSAAQDNSSELQKAYAELQTELESSRANLLTLEADRAHHHQEAARGLDEVDRLTASSREQFHELSALRRELDEQKLAQEEEGDFLQRAQNEIESLRGEILLKDEEIERLRVAVSSNASPTNAPRSLDDEMLSSLKQQHAMDISTAQSQIRTLETTLFEAEARAHSLQKHVGALEAQMLQSRPASRAGMASRPSSRALSHADLRRSSFTSIKPSHLSTSLSRTVFDIGLTPETRHKRRISLSMLKARIDSEVASVASSGSRPPSRALSPVITLPTVREPSLEQDSRPPSFHRPQFLDESHVFWCHACRGDLVIL